MHPIILTRPAGRPGCSQVRFASLFLTMVNRYSLFRVTILKKLNCRSAFFDPRVFVSFLLLFAGSVLAITGFGISAEGQAPKSQSAVT